MPDPTYAEISGAINTDIVTNHNNLITAAVLNPILIGMLDYTSSSIGSLDGLNTEDKTNVVAAINEALARIDDVDTGVVVLQGTEDPNETPPSEAFGIGDMYSQVTVGGLPIDLFIYTGVVWYKLNVPNFADVIAQGGDINVSMLNNDGDGVHPFITALTVDGMNLTANQAASEINLTNADGDIISTISVAFLNNEGTTFIYNDVTHMLELWNDVPEKVSEIPVDDFVSNLVHSASFNATTPSILEFKDTENDIVFSVTYAINNIAGLQAALDLKANDADVIHKAGAETVIGTKTFNTDISLGFGSEFILTNRSDYGGLTLGIDSVSSNALFVDKTTGNVGINTITPDIFSRSYSKILAINSIGTSAFCINGATQSDFDMGVAGNRAFNINVTPTENTISSFGAKPLFIDVNGAIRQTYAANGNIGINNTSPDYTLDVGGIFRNKRTGVNGAGFVATTIIGSDAKTVGDSQILVFEANNSSDEEVTYSRIFTTIEASTAGAQSGSMSFQTYNLGNPVDALKLSKEGNVTTVGGLGLGNGQNLSWGGTYAEGKPTIAGGAGGISFYPQGITSGEKVTFHNNGSVAVAGTVQMADGTAANHGATVGQLDALADTFPEIIYSTQTFDFPSTAIQTASTLSKTVTGAAVGDIVDVTPSIALLGTLILTARVSSANTVTVNFYNGSTSGVDPTPFDIKMRIIK